MIYLDNSATTAPKEEVLSTFVEVNKRFYANPASIHAAGRQADALLEKTREQILSIVGAKEGTVTYTSGGTEANNLAILGFARKFKHRGNHIITTVIEHPSVLQAAKQLACEGFDVDYVNVDDNGVIILDEFEKYLRSDTILVSMMHVNNEIGAVQPIEACAKMIREKSRAVFHVDAVQSFGKLPVLLDEAGPDAVTISGHKIHGLKGTGALLTKGKTMPLAVNYGGGQEQGVRNGTVSVPDAAALARAMRLVATCEKVETYSKWRQLLIEKIEETDGAIILAKETSAPHILSVAFEEIRGEVAVNYFQEQAIYLSTSSACSSKNGDLSHVIEAIKVPERFKDGVIRISFGENNTDADMTQFKKVYTDFIQLLKRGKANDVG